MAEGISAWLPLISTMAGGLLAASVAVFVNRQSHRNALERENRAAAAKLLRDREAGEEKAARERQFIATELVFLLEEFAAGCALVSTDSGTEDSDGYTLTTTLLPELILTAVAGDWRVLPPDMMYRIRELPVLHKEACSLVSSVQDNDSPPDYSDTLWERQYQFARLGLKALILAIRLRRLAGFPPTRLDATPWSAQQTLWTAWRLERKRRTQLFILHQRFIAVDRAQYELRRRAESENTGKTP